MIFLSRDVGPLRPLECRRQMDRLSHTRIGTAATDIRNADIDVGIGRIGLLSQQGGGGHDLARLAVAALGYLFPEPGLLHRMLSVGSETLDRCDALPRDIAEFDRAGPRRYAIEMHRASATQADATPVLGAGESQLIAQYPQKRRFGLDVQSVGIAIDVDGNHCLLLLATEATAPSRSAARRCLMAGRV